MDMAFRTATCGRPGPVYLKFPVNVLNAQVERSAIKTLETNVCSRPVDPPGARTMLEMMKAAEKPVIVVVISNDLGWAMIRHSQEIRIGHAIEAGTFIGRVDYHKIVEAIGGRGFSWSIPETSGRRWRRPLPPERSAVSM